MPTRIETINPQQPIGITTIAVPINYSNMYPNLDRDILGARLNQWFSSLRGNYSNQVGGPTNGPNQAPSFANFSYGFLQFEHINYVLTPDPVENLETIFNPVRQTIVMPTLRPWNNTGDIYSYIIFGMNVVAQIKRKLREYFNDSHIALPARWVDWKVDFIVPCSETYVYADRWRPKFHGRSCLHLKQTTLNSFLEHIRNNQWPEFWRECYNLYLSQRYEFTLDQRAYQTIELLARGQAIPDYTTGRYKEMSEKCDRPTTVLAREYHQRKKISLPVINPKDLARLISDNSSGLPDNIIDDIYSLIRKIR